MAVKKSLKEIIRDEYKKCSVDPVHFMRKYCIIQHPTKGKMYFNLYPFQETVESGKNEAYIIEKIDIGGVSLIRAAAKNFSDVVIVSSRSQYSKVLKYLLSAFLFLIEGSKSTFFPSFFSFSTNSFIALCLFSSIYEYNIPMWLAFL